MANCAKLIEHIRLTQREIEAVAGARARLVEVIKSKADGGRLPSPRDFVLIGSYKRGTKIAPLDDVDMLYVMGYAKRVDNTGRHILTSCDFEFGSTFMEPEDNISSVKVLDLIKRVLQEVYFRSVVRRDGEVVNVYLSSYEVGFDIVPAFWIENDNYYLMPAGSGSTYWKRTNPKIDETILDELNKQHNNLLKNTVRIMKYWFKKKKIRCLRSYHLEAIAYYVFAQKESCLSYSECLQTFYANLNMSGYLKECPDPTRLSGSLTSKLTEQDIQRIMDEAAKALLHLERGEEHYVSYVDPEL